MIAFALRRNARMSNPQVGDHVFGKEIWLETRPEGDLPSPTVSLISQPAGCVLEAHMHRENQFQVFVGGSGTLGPHAVRPVCVHYSGAYTGYGPLVAGPEGLQYFTIRPAYDTWMIPVSRARGQMPRGPKRHALVEVVATPGESSLATLLPLAADGLGVQRWQTPDASLLAIPHLETGCGTFVLVLAGACKVAETVMERLESCFISSSEPGGLLAACEGGVDVLFLHCPAKAAEYA